MFIEQVKFHSQFIFYQQKHIYIKENLIRLQLTSIKFTNDNGAFKAKFYL